MATAEQLNHAKAFLKKAEEYLGSAGDNLIAGRYTPAAGDAVHAGISAKDSIVTALTGATAKSKDHATAAKELKTALGKHAQAATAERAPRELIAAKGEVEYGGESMEIGFNVNYLLDALAAVDSDEVELRVSDANSSCLILAPGTERVKYVVMPMRL